MKVVLTGASGMLGQAVLQECLSDDSIEEILLVSRSELHIENAKVKEIILQDFFEVSLIADKLKGYDVCYFCAGISSSLLNEEQYRRITVDLTIEFARITLKMNPDILFTYISAHGANSSSRVMWARVKGEAEDKLLSLGFQIIHIFRPAYIHPDPGLFIKSNLNRRILFFTKPLYGLLKRFFPRYVIRSSLFGKSMILASKKRLKKPYFEIPDMNEILSGE